MPLNTTKILAISGSLKPNSSNHAILQFLSSIAPSKVDFTIFEGIEQLPHFNPSLDVDDAPSPVTLLRAAITAADGIIICTPEYAFGVPGSLKNALDWTVSSGSFNEKPLAVITASSSGQKAHAALLDIFTALGAKVAPAATLLISFVRTKVNDKGAVTDETTRMALADVLGALIKEISDKD